LGGIIGVRIEPVWNLERALYYIEKEA